MVSAADPLPPPLAAPMLPIGPNSGSPEQRSELEPSVTSTPARRRPISLIASVVGATAVVVVAMFSGGAGAGAQTTSTTTSTTPAPTTTVDPCVTSTTTTTPSSTTPSSTTTTTTTTTSSIVPTTTRPEPDEVADGVSDLGVPVALVTADPCVSPSSATAPKPARIRYTG